MNDEYLTRLDDDNIHVTTRPYLNKVLAHMDPYEVEVFGEKITVLPGVMSPQYDWAGLFMIDCLPKDLGGMDVLELGSGSGLVSVLAGLRGAKRVTAADINPEAVKNTEFNFKKFNLENVQVFLSDVFSAVPKILYDLIIFNLPYHDGKPANDLEKGVMDLEYHAMTAFFKDVKSYLKKNGKMYVGFSQSGDVLRFMEEMKKNGIHLESMIEKNQWERDPRFSAPDLHYNCQVYILSVL